MNRAGRGGFGDGKPIKIQLAERAGGHDRIEFFLAGNFRSENHCLIFRFWLHCRWTLPWFFSGGFFALFQDKARQLCLEQFQKSPGRSGGKRVAKKIFDRSTRSSPPKIIL
jgi:hypothetical protein